MEEEKTQWVAPRSPMTSEDGLTAEFMHSLWRDGIIGYKEMRSWLANNFKSYASIRDPALDAMIDDVARNRFERMHQPTGTAEETIKEEEDFSGLA